MTRRSLNRPPRARSAREVARHARELADAFARARRRVPLDTTVQTPPPPPDKPGDDQGSR